MAFGVVVVDKEAVLQFFFQLDADRFRPVGNLVRFANCCVRFKESKTIDEIDFESVFPLQVTDAAQRDTLRRSKRNLG